MVERVFLRCFIYLSRQDCQVCEGNLESVSTAEHGIDWKMKVDNVPAPRTRCRVCSHQLAFRMLPVPGHGRARACPLLRCMRFGEKLEQPLAGRHHLRAMGLSHRVWTLRLMARERHFFSAVVMLASVLARRGMGGASTPASSPSGLSMIARYGSDAKDG